MTVVDHDHEVRSEPDGGSRARRRLVIAGLALLAISAVGGVFALRGGSGKAHRTAPTYSTATVIRTDLADRTQVDGTLGFADTYTVVGSGRGRLTWVPSVGSSISRGQKVYELDGHSVPLFYGEKPLWRDMKEGMSDGSDVEALESNLSALGYGADMTVDKHFSGETKTAIKEWQKDLGVSQTGVVHPGDVVMLPKALRVTTVTGVVGGMPQGNLLTATGTTRQVTVKLPVNQQELAVDGAQVEIDLPGGKTVDGHITSVGTVATSSDSSGSAGAGTQSATIPVYISLDRSSDAGRLDGAPVTVGFASSVHKGVLAVPINALLAEPDGSYVVEVIETNGQARRVAVQLGVFSEGKVEVSGDLAEGAKVEVPRS